VQVEGTRGSGETGEGGGTERGGRNRAILLTI
jgi:hypothetical protein